MRFLARVPALVSGIAAGLSLILGVALLPPVLEGSILAAGRLPSPAATVVVWILALIALANTPLLARRAWRSWQAARTVDPRHVRLATLATILGLVAAIVFVELAARVVVPLDDVLSEEDVHRKIWIEQGRDATESGLNPMFRSDTHDPDLGWVPRPNYASPDVNIDADGLRATGRPRDRERPASHRIVVVGDSFTFGWDVPDADVYTVLLDTMLPKTDVINLGVHGYGTDQQFLRLRRDGFDYDPDLVVLAYYKTNSGRNVLSFRDYAKPRFRLVDGGLRLENTPVPEPSDSRWVPPTRPLSYFVALVRKNLVKLRAETRFDPQWRLTTAILDEAAAACRDRSIPFMVLYIPAARPNFSRVPEAAETVLTEWARQSGVPLLDLRPAFLELPEDEHDRLYAGHWTPLGHRRAAEFLAAFIAEHGLLPAVVPNL